MKHLVIIGFLICFSYLIVAKPKEIEPKINDTGIGFAFSGAGGRLAQHLALMEALIKGLSPSGKKVTPSYLSGASSGSISAIVLNAIIETQERNLSNGITWESYKKDLFALTNDDIYDISPEGIANIFYYNIPNGYILDNSNLRNFLKPYAAQMNYRTLGDLYLPTAISVVNQSSGITQRFWSDDPAVKNLDLLETVMASTAIPIAFPPATISGLGNSVWIDGGTGIDTIPVYPLLNRKGVNQVYILCYASALKTGGSGDLPFILNDIFILKNALATINDMRVDLFAGAIEMAASSPIDSYSYIPDLNVSFSALEFDYEQLEYQVANAWAVKNNPIHLNKK